MEIEAGLLLTARELIAGMVNHALLCFEDGAVEQCIRPQTSQCATLFNIHLVDFLSELNSPYPERISMLKALRKVCDSPCFDVNGSVAGLKLAVDAFEDWLNEEVRYSDIWLPSIERELNLVMKRREFLYLCRNIAKHNPFRLSGVATKIHAILQRSDATTTLNDAYLAIDEFYEWFHRDIFYYHLSKISELLNEITWGIQDYLTLEFRRAYTIDETKSAIMHGVMYRYDYPPQVQSELGRTYYCNLMNEVRSQPFIPRFKASPYLTMRY